MTSAEKASETRRKNREARERQKKAMNQLTEKLIRGCEDVLNDPEATSSDKIKAVELLNDLRKGR